MANKALGFPFGFFTNDNLPQDAKYYRNFNNDLPKTPYLSVADANAQLTGIRYQGLTVNINGVEYWYKNGITDLDLIIKEPDSIKYEWFNFFESEFPPTGEVDKLYIIRNRNNDGVGGAIYTWDTTNLNYNILNANPTSIPPLEQVLIAGNSARGYNINLTNGNINLFQGSDSTVLTVGQLSLSSNFQIRPTDIYSSILGLDTNPYDFNIYFPTIINDNQNHELFIPAKSGTLAIVEELPIFLDENSTISDFQANRTHYYIGKTNIVYDYDLIPYPIPNPVSNYDLVNLSVYNVTVNSDGGNSTYVLTPNQRLRNVAITDDGDSWLVVPAEFVDNIYDLQQVTNKGAITTDAIIIRNNPDTYRTRYSTIGQEIQKDDLGFRILSSHFAIRKSTISNNKNWEIQYPDLTGNANNSSYVVDFRPNVSGTVAFLGDLTSPTGYLPLAGNSNVNPIYGDFVLTDGSIFAIKRDNSSFSSSEKIEFNGDGIYIENNSSISDFVVNSVRVERNSIFMLSSYNDGFGTLFSSYVQTNASGVILSFRDSDNLENRFEFGADSVFRNNQLSKTGIRYTGFGESDINGASANYTTLVGTSLVPKKYVDDKIEIQSYLIRNTNYTITLTDKIIECTSGITLTLPTAISNTGRSFIFINTSLSTVTVNSVLSQTIGNISPTTSVSVLSGEVLEIVSNGSNWRII